MKKIVSCQPTKAVTRIIPILCFAAQMSLNWKIYLIKTEMVGEKKEAFLRTERL
jgi:hypothetical protein